MDYELTEHARDALAKRQIELEWLEMVFHRPDWTELDQMDDALEHRLARIPEFGDRVLRVIVNVRVRPARIVTVYFDRRRRH